MSFYLLFLFPKNLEAHTTMTLAHHLTPVLPIRDIWCLYLTEFPWSEHHPTFFSSSSKTFFLKPPLSSQWPTIPFSPLFFPDSLPFWVGQFSLTLLSSHPLSLGFSPFWDIGDLLYIVYHLSHPNTIRMCHLPYFLGVIWLWQLWTPNTAHSESTHLGEIHMSPLAYSTKMWRHDLYRP